MRTVKPFPWRYDLGDPAVRLFTASVERFGMDFPSGSRILELGCAETDWLERMHQVDPTYQLTGVDARAERDPNGWRFVQGSACDRDLFRPRSFDAVVMLGALEHFGLGYYGDPVVEGGDILTMQNVVRWLEPGGYVYFDVPCNPTHAITENRHFRIYSPETVTQRLMVPGLGEVNRAYSDCEPHAGAWCDEPVARKSPYHFVAVLARKVAL